ncbi:MAG: hypothetical protein J7639_24695 [Paenibacillaceae bacterium]|nr:hypothetical protein [Paenibacillaceae bacterium]
MKPEEIQAGKTYLMDSGRKRHAIAIKHRSLGQCVDYRQVLKNGQLGYKTYCRLTTFARRCVSEVPNG